MFRERDRERITSGFTHPENTRAYELYLRVLKKDFSHFFTDIKEGRYNLMVCFMIEAKAFSAWVNRDGNEARRVIETAISVIKYYRAQSNVNLMLCRHTGHLVFSVSCMYDWLYPYLRQDEKEYIISRCEELLSASMEMGYPPTKQRDTNSHAHETQLMRDMLGFSIAVYDERPDIYDYCAGRIFDDYVPFYRFAFSGGLHHQGPSYGAYRHSAALWCQLLFYTMSGERIFDKNVETLADSYYYLTRADGENLRIGNDCNDDKGGGIAIKYPFTVVNFLAGAITGNEHYRRYWQENSHDEIMLPSVYNLGFYKYGVYGEGIYSPIVHLIFNRLTEPFTPEPYAKAHHFPYPNGVTVYKDEEKGTTVYMKVGELWCMGHEHYDTGDFQIYHNGILVSSSGAYYIYGNNHFFNYLIRTSAHNCLTVRDPSVKVVDKREMYPSGFAELINDGGTKMPWLTSSYVFEPDIAKDWEKHGRMARVISHTESDELIELVGDLTEAYSHTCEKVIRKMSFMPKTGACGTFTVHDEVTAKSADFIKRFHLHTMTEPRIEGNEITIEHNGGKLICRVIEPANAEIRAIGGGDNRFTLNDEPVPSEKTENRECGWGKIIISPTDKAKHHTFKVEMEIMDSEL